MIRQLLASTQSVRRIHLSTHRYVSEPHPQSSSASHEPPVVEQQSMPHKHNIEYVFRQIRNESIIKGFLFGKFDQKLLKMPDGQASDTAVRTLLDKLTGMDLNPRGRMLQQLKYLGIFGAIIPTEYGGLGLTISQYSFLLQNSKLIDWSLCLIAHQNLCAQTILLYGSEEQKAIYLPKLASGECLGAFCLTEPSSGSDMFSMKTEAAMDLFEKNYILNGLKTWVINGAVADIFIVFALTQDSVYEGGRTQMTGFIVDRDIPGIKVSDEYDINWLTNCHVADVSFNDVMVSVDKVLFEDHGGYKIANDVQNNARFLIGSSMAGICRLVIDDLISKQSRGLIPLQDPFITNLMDRCATHLYCIESCVYFTTRFADKYVIPEIELESAVVKVFSTEHCVEILDSYRMIIQYLKQPLIPQFETLYCRVKGVQNFMGSNFFTRLFIGGTMVQLSSVSLTERALTINKSMKNVPWMDESRKDSFPTGEISITEFMAQLKNIFRKLFMARVRLYQVLKRFEAITPEYQCIMIAMAKLGEAIYVLSCSVARANTTFGNFEIRCTQNLINETEVVVEKCLEVLSTAATSHFTDSTAAIAEDIKIAKGYATIDILDITRFKPKPSRPVNKFDDTVTHRDQD